MSLNSSSSLKFVPWSLFKCFRLWHNHPHVKFRSFEIILDFSLIIVSNQLKFLSFTSSVYQCILSLLYLWTMFRLVSHLFRRDMIEFATLSPISASNPYFKELSDWTKWSKKIEQRWFSKGSLQNSRIRINWEIVWNENLKLHPQTTKWETLDMGPRIFVL